MSPRAPAKKPRIGPNQILHDFFRCILLCHDITKVTDRNGKTFLTGASQDELVLLEMAAEKGIAEFIQRDSAEFVIRVDNKLEHYDNLKFYDFDSARKMMTRVVRNQETGMIYAMSKGAD